MQHKILYSVGSCSKSSEYEINTHEYCDKHCTELDSHVNIPVIASGGVGELNHFYLGYLTKATGLLAASVFHSGKYKIAKVKQYLNAKGVPVRL